MLRCAANTAGTQAQGAGCRACPSLPRSTLEAASMLPGKAPAPHLEGLDDPLLLHCFSFLTPLPDLFNVAASCRRFRDLALDRRSWLYVTHAAVAPLLRPSSRHERALLLRLPARAASTHSLGGSGIGTAAAAAAAPAAVPDDSPHWYCSRFASLAAAVAASRPGDTILLEVSPVPHIIATPVVVPHPVHILGGGAVAEDCVLEGALGLDALIDFRASGRLANLSLRAISGACVAHTRGRLTVQGCTLECDARGLPHLMAPLLTRAVSWPRPPPTVVAPAAATCAAAGPCPVAVAGTSTVAATAAAQRMDKKRPAHGLACSPEPPAEAHAHGAGGEEPAAAKRLRARREGAEAAAGAGVLSVAETRIKARGSAVELRGSGRLSAVRAIYSYGHALVWLQVDSADALGGREFLAAAGVLATVSPAGGNNIQVAVPAAAPLPATPLPSWVSRAAAVGFDAADFQRRAQRLMTPPPAVSPTSSQQLQKQQQQGLAGGSTMEQKAGEWCLQHHAALAPAAPEAAASLPPQG